MQYFKYIFYLTSSTATNQIIKLTFQYAFFWKRFIFENQKEISQSCPKNKIDAINSKNHLITLFSFMFLQGFFFTFWRWAFFPCFYMVNWFESYHNFAEKNEFFLLDKVAKRVGGGSVINGAYPIYFFFKF